MRTEFTVKFDVVFTEKWGAGKEQFIEQLKQISDVAIRTVARGLVQTTGTRHRAQISIERGSGESFITEKVAA